MWCNLDCFFHMHVTYIFVEIFRVSLQIIAWVSTMPHIEVKKDSIKTIRPAAPFFPALGDGCAAKLPSEIDVCTT